MALKKIKNTLMKQLLAGRRPAELSLSVAFGAVLGLFPVPGVATALCFLAATSLRLNHVVIQAVNYAVYPLQIGMLGVYYALANLWFGSEGTLKNLGKLPGLLSVDLVAGLQALGQAALPVIGVWLLTGLPAVMILYLMVRPVISKLPAAGTSTRGSRRTPDERPPKSCAPCRGLSPTSSIQVRSPCAGSALNAAVTGEIRESA